MTLLWTDTVHVYHLKGDNMEEKIKVANHESYHEILVSKALLTGKPKLLNKMRIHSKKEARLNWAILEDIINGKWDETFKDPYIWVTMREKEQEIMNIEYYEDLKEINELDKELSTMMKEDRAKEQEALHVEGGNKAETQDRVEELLSLKKRATMYFPNDTLIKERIIEGFKRQFSQVPKESNASQGLRFVRRLIEISKRNEGVLRKWKLFKPRITANYEKVFSQVHLFELVKDENMWISLCINKMIIIRFSTSDQQTALSIVSAR